MPIGISAWVKRARQVVHHHHKRAAEPECRWQQAAVIGADQQSRQMRNDQPDPGDAAADCDLGGDQHRAANQHSAAQCGHRNAKTARIFIIQSQQVDTPAQL